MFAAFVFQHAALDFADMVIKAAVAGEIKGAAAGADAVVVSTEDEAVNARLDERAGTHDAGFERYIEAHAAHAVVAQRLTACAQGEDFGVCGRVVVADGAVMRAGNDFAVCYENRANRYFAEGFGERCLFEGEAEVVFVAHGCA